MREDAVLEDNSTIYVGDRIEIYGLWYEYLKLNEYYKEFCRWIKIFGINDLYNEGDLCWEQFSESMLPDNWQASIDLPEKLKGYKYLYKLPDIFHYWGDIYSVASFNDWIIKLANLSDTYRYFFDPEHPFYPDIGYSYDIGRMISSELMIFGTSYHQEHGRDPSFKEVEAYFLNSKRISRTYGYLHLSIPLDMPFKKIKEQCEDIFKKEKNKWDRDKSILPVPDIESFRGKKSSYKEKIISLRECLEVYKERQNNPKKPWWEIAGTLEKKGIKLGDNFEVTAIQRYNNAITLIKNTGSNKFPDYSKE